MKKISLQLIAALTLFYPSLALACGPTISIWMILGVPMIHFLPIAIGNLIVGKGKRLWFFLVSLFYYITLYAVSGGFNLLQSGWGAFTLLLLPYVLVIAAMIKKVEN